MYRTSSLETKIALETGIYIIKGIYTGICPEEGHNPLPAKGQQADTKLNLVQGVNITVNIKFKKEGIFTHVPYNQ